MLAITATSNSFISVQIKHRSWIRFSNVNTENDKTQTLEVHKSKYSDVEKRELDLQFTAGRFTLADGSDAYFKVEAKYSENFGEP